VDGKEQGGMKFGQRLIWGARYTLAWLLVFLTALFIASVVVGIYEIIVAEFPDAPWVRPVAVALGLMPFIYHNWTKSDKKKPPQIRQKLTPKYQSTVRLDESPHFVPWDDEFRIRWSQQEPLTHRTPKNDGWWSAKDEREL
jgi:hypothetical protein